MNRQDEMQAVLEQTSFKLSRLWRNLFILMAVVGAVAFIFGVTSQQPRFTWQALLVNTLFFGGISCGGLIFSVIFTITSAHWGRPIKRLAEAMAAFFPVAALFFLLLFLGAEYFFEWMDPAKVIHAKAGWLNYPFFVIRNIVLFSVFAAVSWYYLRVTLRPDIGLAKKLVKFSNSFADRLVTTYQTQEKEEERSLKKAKTIAPVLGLLFAILATIQAFDWMMSIDQEWFSTLFGVQYVVANLIGASAALMIIAGIARREFRLEDYITVTRYHDLSKLTFAFCLLWTYMIFSQVLVIWYANLPEETPYLILRIQSLEWGWMFWLIMILLFIIPFFGLISRTACNSIWFSRLIAIEILVGLWLEKYFLIVPSIQENMAVSESLTEGGGLPGFTPNIYDLTLTLGVFGLFMLCYFWFLQKVPVVPVADPYFFKQEKH